MRVCVCIGNKYPVHQKYNQLEKYNNHNTSYKSKLTIFFKISFFTNELCICTVKNRTVNCPVILCMYVMGTKKFQSIVDGPRFLAEICEE